MTSVITKTLSTWSRLIGRTHSPFLSLPEDIIVNHIFYWLTVKEIIRLRRVCKGLSLLTRKASIWKCLLPYIRHLPHHLAPLPPSNAYNLHSLTSFDLETVITRAISYDLAWKKDTVTPHASYGCTSYHHIEEIVILPGGHFLLSSVKSHSGEYGLIIWAVQHPATQKPVALLYRQTEVKAYALTARYMTVRGKKGITVSFLRKYHKIRNDTRHIPENFEMGGPEDVEETNMRLKYECSTLHVPLSIIDALMDRHIEPASPDFETRMRELIRQYAHEDLWTLVSRIRTGRQLGVVSLDIIDRQPYVCVLKKPDTIVFECLEDNIRSELICRPYSSESKYQMFQSIWNFRVIPSQGCVLAVRGLSYRMLLPGSINDSERHNQVMIEIFLLPERAKKAVHEARERLSMVQTLKVGDWFRSAKISEIQRHILEDEDDSITPILMDKERERAVPITIYLQTNEGMHTFTMWPLEMKTADSSSVAGPPRDGRVLEEKRLIYTIVCNSCEAVYPTFPRDIVREDDDPLRELLIEDEKEWDIKRSSTEFHPYDMIRCLPGAYRAVLFYIPKWYNSTSPPVTDLIAYRVGKACEMRGLTIPNGAVLVVPKELDPEARSIYPGIDIPLSRSQAPRNVTKIKLEKELDKLISLGVTATCFDEDTGRLVFATRADNSIHVLDFSVFRVKGDDDRHIERMMDKELSYEKMRFL